MLSRFLYGFLNFFLYLTPLYLFFIKVWSEKLKFKYWMDVASNRLLISLSALILTVFIMTGIVWKGIQIFTPIFYLFWFLVFLWKLPRWLGGFDNFVISVMCIFAMSEVWELPIIANNIYLNDLTFLWQNIFLSSLKLVSVPILYFYARDYKPKGVAWEIIYEKREVFDIAFLTLIITLAFFSFTGLSSITFSMGILIRMIVAIVLYIYILGFKAVEH